MEALTVVALLLVAAAALFAWLLVKVLRSRRQAADAVEAAAPPAQPRSLDVAPPYKLVQARHGWMLVNPNDLYLGRAIVDYGECCEIEVQFLLDLLSIRTGDAVEIGANIGTHTVPLAKALAARGRRLLVFEPQPFIFQNLCANLAVNGLSNVTAWPFACGNEDTTVHFARPDYAAVDNFGGVAMTPERSAGTVAVPCRRLDGIVDLDAVGLIKVDVEGFELLALQGAEATLDRFRPILYVENDRIDQSPALVEWLWSKNYRLWWHTPLLFNPGNFFANPVNLYEGVGSFNMLCIPREHAVPVEGLYEVLTGSHPLATASQAHPANP